MRQLVYGEYYHRNSLYKKILESKMIQITKSDVKAGGLKITLDTATLQASSIALFDASTYSKKQRDIIKRWLDTTTSEVIFFDTKYIKWCKWDMTYKEEVKKMDIFSYGKCDRIDFVPYANVVVAKYLSQRERNVIPFMSEPFISRLLSYGFRWMPFSGGLQKENMPDKKDRKKWLMASKIRHDEVASLILVGKAIEKTGKYNPERLELLKFLNDHYGQKFKIKSPKIPKNTVLDDFFS